MMERAMFDDVLLQAFMDGFYGYGNFGGDYWFVGKEEGGEGSFEDIIHRMNGWDQRGRNELEDSADYHAAIGVNRYFGDQPKLQQTWMKLIRVLLAAEGKDFHVESVRTYQQNLLARRTSNNCLLELMPLPSPSTGQFVYAQYSGLAALTSRKSYLQHYAAGRANHIQNRVNGYKPKVVVFYSDDQWYQGWWKHIAGVAFASDSRRGFQIGSNGQTVFAIMRHPTGFGTSNAYCQAVGTAIRTALSPTRNWPG